MFSPSLSSCLCSYLSSNLGTSIPSKFSSNPLSLITSKSCSFFSCCFLSSRSSRFGTHFISSLFSNLCTFLFDLLPFIVLQFLGSCNTSFSSLFKTKFGTFFFTLLCCCFGNCRSNKNSSSCTNLLECFLQDSNPFLCDSNSEHLQGLSCSCISASFLALSSAHFCPHLETCLSSNFVSKLHSCFSSSISTNSGSFLTSNFHASFTSSFSANLFSSNASSLSSCLSTHFFSCLLSRSSTCILSNFHCKLLELSC